MSQSDTSNIISNWPRQSDARHVVSFYRSDATLIAPLSDYFAAGFADGETCLAIATPAHILSLNQSLEQKGYDIAALKAANKYITLDAAETLKRFMVDDLPDREKFMAFFGDLAVKHSTDGRPVRAFGEMVAQLWKVSNQEAIIPVERLWDELTHTHNYYQFCAYPELHFLQNKRAQQQIRGCHSLILMS